MSGGIGPFGSKMCVEIVDQFYACRRTHGVSGMVVGECAAMFREMNDCLDRESEIRRKENLAQSKERKKRYEALIAEQEDIKNHS